MTVIENLQDYLPDLLRGVVLTVELTLSGAALALVMALIAGLTNLTPWWPVRTVSRVYIEVFRGTSEIIQLFWVYLALPILLGIQVPIFIAGFLVLGLNLGAYGAEVVRGAVLAVPRAQYEGATALSFTSLQRMRRVVLPQAFAGMVPPLNNLFIQLLKSTALVSAIGAYELLHAANLLVARVGDIVLIFTTILVIYFILAQIIVLFMRWVERRSKANLGEPQPKLRSRLLPGFVR